MNVSSALTKDYENERLYRCGENKPNQTQPVVSLPALSIVEVSNLFQRQKNPAPHSVAPSFALRATDSVINASGVDGGGEKQIATFWQMKTCPCAGPRGVLAYRVWCR